MSILNGKKVLLGVTGGIAAYKTPLIVRLLIKQGAEVKVVMTPSATDFVTPINPIYPLAKSCGFDLYCRRRRGSSQLE